MKITAVVTAAGRGRRLKADPDKAFVLLDKNTILFYSLKSLERTKEIEEIVLVVSKRSLRYARNKFLNNFGFPKVKKVVAGGKTRTDSVWNGLQAVDKKTELILIHDGVRPFVDYSAIKRVIKAGEKFGAAALGIPVKSTIKKIKNFCVTETVERKFLWEAQTPQVFLKGLLLNCYRRAREEKVKATDDAQILEHYGYKARAVKGSPLNIKITTPEDLVLARAILKTIHVS